MHFFPSNIEKYAKDEQKNTTKILKSFLPELDAGFLKWYSKYFGTKVPNPTTPKRRKIVDRALKTYTCRSSMIVKI